MPRPKDAAAGSICFGSVTLTPARAEYPCPVKARQLLKRIKQQLVDQESTVSIDSPDKIQETVVTLGAIAQGDVPPHHVRVYSEIRRPINKGMFHHNFVRNRQRKTNVRAGTYGREVKWAEEHMGCVKPDIAVDRRQCMTPPMPLAEDNRVCITPPREDYNAAFPDRVEKNKLLDVLMRFKIDETVERRLKSRILSDDDKRRRKEEKRMELLNDPAIASAFAGDGDKRRRTEEAQSYCKTPGCNRVAHHWGFCCSLCKDQRTVDGRIHGSQCTGGPAFGLPWNVLFPK